MPFIKWRSLTQPTHLSGILKLTWWQELLCKCIFFLGWIADKQRLLSYSLPNQYLQQPLDVVRMGEYLLQLLCLMHRTHQGEQRADLSVFG